MRRNVLISILVLSCAFASRPASADARVKVIVNPSVPGDRMTRATLASVFLSETSRWGDGKLVQAVDQSVQSSARAAFSNDLLGRPVAAVQNHWLRQVTAGGARPPLVKETDADVFEFVRTNPGAIGYVSAGYPTDARVRVVSVVD